MPNKPTFATVIVCHLDKISYPIGVYHSALIAARDAHNLRTHATAISISATYTIVRVYLNMEEPTA